MEVPVWFWNGRPNFGDQLTIPVLEQEAARLGLEDKFRFVPSARPADALVVGAGSVLQRFPPMWAGHVCGTGSFEVRHKLPRATFWGVRGPRTHQYLSTPPPFFDLGLLLQSRKEEKKNKNKKVVLIPHYVDYEFTKAAFGKRYTVLDICVEGAEGVAQVAEELASADLVLSSSLHGLVASDALGVPSLRFTQNELVGGDHKFRDYDKGLGMLRHQVPLTLKKGMALEKYIEPAKKLFALRQKRVDRAKERARQAVEGMLRSFLVGL